MNQQLGRNQIIDAWTPALQDGIEANCEHPVAEPRLDVAFFGDLFLPRVLVPAKGHLVEESWTDADAEVLAIHVDELAGPDVDPFSDDELLAKAHTGVPLPVARLLARLDRVLGSKIAARLFMGELKQVRRYLGEPELKAKADARMAAAATAGAKVLLGHSLGSVVALEFLRQHPECYLPRLITLGSPLGLKTVRILLPDPGFGFGGLPANIGSWRAFRDPHDPVACAGDLCRLWSGVVDDATIHNDVDAHSAQRYLCKRQVGAAVAEVLPEITREVSR